MECYYCGTGLQIRGLQNEENSRKAVERTGRKTRKGVGRRRILLIYGRHGRTLVLSNDISIGRLDYRFRRISPSDAEPISLQQRSTTWYRSTLPTASPAWLWALGASTSKCQLDCGMLLRVEALYVPDFRVSLFSVRQLTKAGIVVLFREDNCYVLSSAKVGEQLLGRLQDGSGAYTLLGTVTSDRVQANSANPINPANPADSPIPGLDLQTHRRLAHLNYGDLRQLLPRALYREGTNQGSHVRHLCQGQGKGAAPAEGPGSSSNQASGGNPLGSLWPNYSGFAIRMSVLHLYIDVSRFSWISFLRNKISAEVCKVFTEFKAPVELKFGPDHPVPV